MPSQAWRQRVERNWCEADRSATVTDMSTSITTSPAFVVVPDRYADTFNIVDTRTGTYVGVDIHSQYEAETHARWENARLADAERVQAEQALVGEHVRFDSGARYLAGTVLAVDEYHFATIEVLTEFGPETWRRPVHSIQQRRVAPLRGPGEGL